MNSYPVFLQLKDFRCLVVGGGAVALRKVKGLLSAGALPQIISPEVSAELHLIIGEHQLVWKKRKFEQNDTQGFQLIVAATNNKKVNATIRLEAVAAHLLVNDVTDPAGSNFHVPALVSRPPLMLAIGTSGEVPYLSHKLKALFEDLLPPYLDNDIEKIRKCRESIMKQSVDNQKLKEQLINNELNPLVEDFLCGLLNKKKTKHNLIKTVLR